MSNHLPLLKLKLEIESIVLTRILDLLSPPPPPFFIPLSLYRSLSHAMLERADSYLWSQRPSAVGPQIVAVQNLERPAEQAKVCYFV